ncbi:MAG: type II toxin-antitoxin system PemK/MazF family toxin [Phaeodactylibacter sp.]|nr:type II toxin-antitoxin system PemK/MazF family toxin [Phaeodactylibacter sp.]MCB9299700.1 type II toxin-antitoxin system PemK/MazF family toxin [Lewinellaceae bacterium]
MKHSIVLVPFPFDDLTGTKVRPAVCLTEEISGYNHVIIAFITSNTLKASEKSDLILDIKDPEFYKTGLKVTSAIRLHRLVTLPSRIILRKLGDLPSPYKSRLELKLKTLFGL